jgi:DNA end-binding protein Ku
MPAPKKPRSLWNGTITLGLLNVPVKLHTATENKTVHFRQVHLKDGAPVEHRRFCSKEGKEVDYDDVVKGYEQRNGDTVILEPDEIKAAAGDRAHIIDVEACVPLADIDPVFFDKTYYLGAGDDGGSAYRLLHDALEQTGRAALGRFVFHDREYLVAVAPHERPKILRLHTLRFADEIVAGTSLKVDKPSKAPSKQEITMAGKLVKSLHATFRPDKEHDEYRELVLKLLEAKGKGKEIELPEEPDTEATDDLLAALEASLS